MGGETLTVPAAARKRLMLEAMTDLSSEPRVAVALMMWM
jgi:hypothetical protein